MYISEALVLRWLAVASTIGASEKPQLSAKDSVIELTLRAGAGDLAANAGHWCFDLVNIPKILSADTPGTTKITVDAALDLTQTNLQQAYIAGNINYTGNFELILFWSRVVCLAAK